MSFYKPCHNCVLEKLPCSRREAVATGIKGLGLKSADFRCTERVSIFAVGQRVLVTWEVPDLDDEYHNYGTAESWPATVVAERAPKFQILVDDVSSDHETPARDYIKNESLYCKVPAARLSPLDEPAREVCGTCQGVPANGTVLGCYGYEDGPHGYTPNGCLKARLPFLAAQAIEARRAETQSGSVHESAVGEADAPEG